MLKQLYKLKEWFFIPTVVSGNVCFPIHHPWTAKLIITSIVWKKKKRREPQNKLSHQRLHTFHHVIERRQRVCCDDWIWNSNARRNDVAKKWRKRSEDKKNKEQTKEENQRKEKKRRMSVNVLLITIGSAPPVGNNYLALIYLLFADGHRGVIASKRTNDCPSVETSIETSGESREFAYAAGSLPVPS